MNDNPLKQYINLYEEHERTVRDNAPAAMNARRADALSVLYRAELPRRGSDGYVHTDLRAMFAPDYGVNITRVPFRADLAAAYRCGVPGVTTLTGVLANDVFGPTESLATRLPEGVTVCAFSRAEERCPGVLSRYYGTVADGNNPAVALNDLLAQDGVLIYLRRGVRLPRPVQLVAILGGVTSPLLALRRILIVLEEDAECQVLVCDHANGDSEVPLAADTVVETVLAEGARLEYIDMQESAGDASRYACIAVRQDARSNYRANFSTLRCGATRNDLHVSLNGEGAECLVSGMAITGENQVADNSTVIVHNAPRCHSDQLFKYVADGQSRGAFEGLIRVQPGAHHTEAYQNNRNVLASAGARMHSRPQLEIYCDDVRANHGAATGQIDGEALYYMRTRGIPEHEARTMLMQAFMSDVIDKINILPLRERMYHLVARRLGNPADMTAACGSCAPVEGFGMAEE